MGGQFIGREELKGGSVHLEAQNKIGLGEVRSVPVHMVTQSQGAESLLKRGWEESEPRPFLLKGTLAGFEERLFFFRAL